MSDVLFEGKNNIEFTHAVQHHSAMLNRIAQWITIVSENGILNDFAEKISNFYFQVHILPLVALLAFVYFLEMMKYVTGPVGLKVSPELSKELRIFFLFSKYNKK